MYYICKYLADTFIHSDLQLQQNTVLSYVRYLLRGPKVVTGLTTL